MRSPLVLGLLLCGLSSLGFAQEVKPPAEGQLRIGTWNIENFGKRRPARTDEDVAALAAFVKELGVDVLALQEINGTKPLHKLVEALGADYDFLLGTTGTFRKGNAQIGVGFLWNRKRVELVHAEEFLDLPSKAEDGNWIFHRKPVSAVFRSRATGFDFRAVVVHLKAGRLKEGDRWEQNVAKRSAEVAALGERLEKLLAREGEDQDLVVLGDFNHDPDYPSYKAFAKHVKYLSPVKKHRSITWFDEQIDHVAVSKGLMAHVVEGTHRIWFARHDKDPKAYKKRYSDHIPLTVDLDASKDDDPDATFQKPGINQGLKPARKPRSF